MNNIYGYVGVVTYKFVEEMGKKFVTCNLSNYHLLSGHLDKCYQYKEEWETAGIPFGHGCLIYLLSFCWPWNQTIRQTPRGVFVKPDEWVISQYTSDSRIKEVIDSLPVIISSENESDNYIKVYVNGSLKYTVKRKSDFNSEPSLWVLEDLDKNEIDRDRYEGYLFDRIKNGQYENHTHAQKEVVLSVADLKTAGYREYSVNDSSEYVSLQKRIRDDKGIRYFIEARVTSMAKYKNCPKKSIFEFVVQFQNPDDLPTFTASFGIGLRQTAQSVTDTETAIDVLWKKLGSNYYERN